jgi:hypothetical protein
VPPICAISFSGGNRSFRGSPVSKQERRRQGDRDSCNPGEDASSEPTVSAPEQRRMKAIARMLLFPIDGC